jgi:hypothetical protein
MLREMTTSTLSGRLPQTRAAAKPTVSPFRAQQASTGKNASPAAAAATPATAAKSGNWFSSVNVTAAQGYAPSYTMNQNQTASQSGAEEALRLVQRFVPGASMESGYFGGGPWSSDNPIYYVALPNGERLNAGLILDTYYNHGQGEAGASRTLALELSHLTGGVNVTG